MKVIPFIYDDIDELFANTYLLVDNNNDVVVIDPSKDNDNIINFIKKNNYHLKAILLTHGHVDHIRGVDRLVREFNVPLYMGFDEVNFLTNTYLNASFFLGKPFTIESKPITVSDSEVLHILDEDIVCIHTPFHTRGSICYHLSTSKYLFSGDFLFKGSVGRSDLPTGSPKTLHDSLNKVLILDKDTKVYPGHGPFTTIELEKKGNPFIK